MRIIVCGAQMPFMHGGAEMHMDNLVGAIRDAGHECELVRLPVAWDKRGIFESALAWRLAPVNADIVIATNFPSYYVVHPHKVVWLFHQHRGAYDAADMPWSDFGYDSESLELQRLLATWDVHALEEARAVFTTSNIVGARLAQFNGLTSTVLYHPPPLHDRLHSGSFGDYVFAPMRLEQNKRPELIVKALARWDPDVSAVLTGPGTMEQELRNLAATQGTARRLDIRGFIDDAALIDAFAGALGVIYAPVDEDYGYVTLQAFLAGKPVITARDSGGPLEWVQHGVNGIVTDGSPEAIAAAVDELAADRERAARMGAAGRRAVARLSWPHVVSTLLSAGSKAPAKA